MSRIVKAILKINPAAEVQVSDDNFDTLEWHNGTTPISQADIEAQFPAVDADLALLRVQTKRQHEYPSFGDQLDMQYQDKKDGTTTWEDAVQAVKDANPKP
tara:strand:- start:42 stop:344 length:303 start_codon:yes stop_codon:yes gene_type:complete